MTPEEAKQELERYQNPTAREEMQARATALPAPLSETALALIEGLRTGVYSSNPEVARKRAQTKKALAALTDEQLGQLAAVLFPSIATYVEMSWQLQKKLPYQVGYARMAFRAPNDPAYTVNTRASWLEELLRAVWLYRYDLDFLIVWAAHVGWGAEHSIGLLLAAVLDAQTDEAQQTLEKLIAIVNGEHPVARIGRYAVTALLCCSRLPAWEAVERLLLAAQRQEGLRQVVMESVDFAHPEAFRRMLRLIEREKLSRFAAVARGAAVWFGMNVDSAEGKMIDGLISRTTDNLEQPAACAEQIKSGKGESLYLALWAGAFNDAVALTEQAAPITREPDFERRYAAVHLVSQLGTTKAARLLVSSLADSDLRVALKAASALPNPAHWNEKDSAAAFDALRQLVPRVPEEKVLDPAIWEWNRLEARRSHVTAQLIMFRGNHPFAELNPFVADMDANGRALLLRSIQTAVKKQGELKKDERDLAFSLLSDASTNVREQAFITLKEAQVSAEEAQSIEPLLSRKASDLRRGVMRLLLKQPMTGCRASVERLAASSDKLMQQAADELRAEIEPQSVPAASLTDGLGLYDPAERTSPAHLRADVDANLISAAADQVLQSFLGVMEKHRETPVTITNQLGQNVSELLGNLRWLGRGGDLPLSEVWDEWLLSIKRDLGETAEIESIRAFCILALVPRKREPAWQTTAAAAVLGARKPFGGESWFQDVARQILARLALRNISGNGLSLVLDVLEAYLSALTRNVDSAAADHEGQRPWRTTPLRWLLQFLNSSAQQHPAVWTPADWRRYWALLRFVDEGVAQGGREFPPLEIVLEARRQGAASEADIYNQLLSTRRFGPAELAMLTKRKTSAVFEKYPELSRVVENCRNRILDVELKRGDLPTAASALVPRLRCIFGAELALTILHRLGKDVFSRGYLLGSESKSVLFSHLLRVSVPAENDTLQSFANSAKQFAIPKKRLIDFAVYAPQWAPFVEHATGIAGFKEAALWLHAHTKDTHWVVDEQIRELWFAELSERTSVTREELLDGAVDVGWFSRMRSAIADKDWTAMLDSAKYASGGAGHKRAELFASALTGGETREKLGRDIAAKRNQDSVRALGLLPLPEQMLEQRAEILRRYEILQEFLRGAKKFGAQRQASEKLAYSIGLANLARTAGYPDPQRLSWAMEAEAAADLRAGSIEAVDGAVRGVLSINALGEPELVFEKNGKTLKDLPATLRKSPALSELRSRKSELSRQASRMRLSLEEAMIRGDAFTRDELEELRTHPLLKWMISCLLFVSDDRKTAWGTELNHHDGRFRIAHPVDLLDTGAWIERQKECIEQTRVQPFKQAFRELYLLTSAERTQERFSSRYEGQQVNPKQAMAVIGKRGWVNVPEEGLRRTFHHDNVSAWVTFLEGWFTPAEVDGLTVEHVLFTNRCDGKPLPLDQINPRVFSESMRDLDLMVSVAHRGGVDPEATASTVEMRAALLRETLKLLKITNVRLNQQHAFVDGKIGAYNIHLGSGIVHRQPGGSLCIIPVHSQHRGRLFLPFADDDPKTAEVVSKVLLLAQDDKIKDPTILEQLR